MGLNNQKSSNSSDLTEEYPAKITLVKSDSPTISLPKQIPSKNEGKYDIWSDNLDPKDYLEPLLKGRKIYTTEPWEKTIHIQAKIISIQSEIVTCDCLLDKELGIFESRNFTKDLFTHIDRLKEKPMVLITIKSKSGSIRIDIVDGTKIIDPKLFDLKYQWQDLEGYDLGNPPDSPIKI